MDFDFIKIFVLFLLLTPGFLFKEKDYLLYSLLKEYEKYYRTIRDNKKRYR